MGGTVKKTKDKREKGIVVLLSLLAIAYHFRSS
jgi:hypothetical protein